MRPVELAEAVRAFAESRPDAWAVVIGAEFWTRAELVRGADGLATRLRDGYGIGTGARVAVMGDNDHRYVEAIVAVCSLDASVVPVAPRPDADAVHTVIDRSDAVVVLHDPAFVDSVVAAAKRIPKPWQPALLPLTGEVAGTPTAGFPPDADGPPRVLIAASLTSDAGFRAAASALANGHTIALVPGVRIAASQLLDAAARARVETIVIAGEAFAAPMAAALADRPTRDLSALTTIASPAAPIHRSTRAALERGLPGVEVHAETVDDDHTPQRVLSPATIERVETGICKHMSVLACTLQVVGIGSAAQLVAFVEVAAGHYLDEAELRAWSRSRLNLHPIPDRFVIVDRPAD